MSKDKFISILSVIGPAILLAVPGAQPFAPLIIAGIRVAEESGKNGAGKKQVAIDVAKLGAQVTNTIAKKDILNPAKVEAVASSTIDLVVDVVNKAGEHIDNAPVITTITTK